MTVPSPILSPEQAVPRLAAALREGRLAFLFGAGVSAEYPTKLPMADDLKKAIFEMLERSVPPGVDLPQEALTYLHSFQLERLLNQLTDVLGTDALRFYDILKREEHELYGPNARHFLMASLARSGSCGLFLTVNFDTAFEQALQELQVPHVVPEQNASTEARVYTQLATTRKTATTAVLKLHGTLTPADTANATLLATVERVGIGLPEYKRKAIDRIQRQNELCLLGYGCEHEDLDVFPVLRSCESGLPLYWYVHAVDSSSPATSLHCSRVWYRSLVRTSVTCCPPAIFLRLPESASSTVGSRLGGRMSLRGSPELSRNVSWLEVS